MFSIPSVLMKASFDLSVDKQPGPKLSKGGYNVLSYSFQWITHVVSRLNTSPLPSEQWFIRWISLSNVWTTGGITASFISNDLLNLSETSKSSEYQTDKHFKIMNPLSNHCKNNNPTKKTSELSIHAVQYFECLSKNPGPF